MKSFRVYLPGGREVSRAGLVVVAIAAVAMIGCAFSLDSIAKMLPGLTMLQAKYLLIAIGVFVVECGWLGFKLTGVPFAKKEPNQSPQRNAGGRPSSKHSSATEDPSSLGPRG